MELIDVENLIHDRLTADGALAAIVGDRVYSMDAPKGAAMPYVVYKLSSAPVTNGVGGVVILARPSYLIVVSGQTRSLSSLEAAAERVLALLQGNFGAIGGVLREQVAYPELFDGISYRHLGGLFDFYASPTS
jgi:hypothetical protein